MDEAERSMLRKILDDYEAGKLSDTELDRSLNPLSPEQLGWIAAESIRRFEALAQRTGTGKREIDNGLGLQGDFVQ